MKTNLKIAYTDEEKEEFKRRIKEMLFEGKKNYEITSELGISDRTMIDLKREALSPEEAEEVERIRKEADKQERYEKALRNLLEDLKAGIDYSEVRCPRGKKEEYVEELIKRRINYQG